MPDLQALSKLFFKWKTANYATQRLPEWWPQGAHSESSHADHGDT